MLTTCLQLTIKLRHVSVAHNILCYMRAPEQLPVSVEYPVHGVVPFVKLLVLFLFASMLHVPIQVPQGFHADHEPSTG